MKTTGLFYREKPLFGFDIGHGSIKVAQISHAGKKPRLEGYGTSHFDPKSVRDGEIIDFKTLAEATHRVISENLTGSITTNRIAGSLPVLRTYSRIISLPVLEDKDVKQAVQTEAEQYIPIPISELYLDYQLVEKTQDSQNYLVAAASKKVVDSYIKLFSMLGLEAVCLEPSILSVTRVVQNADEWQVPTLVIDCGSTTTDLIIYHKSLVRVTGTIKFGGETVTQNIMNSMGISIEEAQDMKSKYGLDAGKYQAKITKALSADLQFLTSEIRKIIRFFEERNKDQAIKVGQVIILGGGANLPGFSTYLTGELRVPTRLANIWKNIDLKHIEPPSRLDTTMYATAVGLALTKPKEIYHD